MSYPLRLPPALDADARKRCERLGISLNSLICVALDAYLSGTAPGNVPAVVSAHPALPQKSEAEQALADATSSPDYLRYVKGQHTDGTPLSDAELADLDEEIKQGVSDLEAEIFGETRRPQRAKRVVKRREVK